jgi:uncharacterized protein YabE (DUF348 family)
MSSESPTPFQPNELHDAPNFSGRWVNPDEISPKGGLRRILFLFGTLTLVCSAVCGLVVILPIVTAAPPVTVTLILGDAASQHETHAPTVADFMQELAITLGDGDSISPLPETPITPGMTIWIARARAVTLTIEDEAKNIQTLFTNPLDILNEAGVPLADKDRIWVDGTETNLADLLVWPVPAVRIAVRRAVTVRIWDGGQQTDIQTASETVAEALYEGGFTLYLADTVEPDLNAAVLSDMEIRIHRSSPISIVADGVTLETRAQGSVVADALGLAGVMLMGLDYSIPDENSPMQPGMIIRVIRVTEQIEAEQSVIPFETVYQPDGALELDQQIVAQEGQNGIEQTNIRVRYENGVEVSRTIESSAVASEPINRVISYGTNVVIRTLDTPDGPVEYWRHIRMYATSYHPAALGGDDITATGRRLTKGIVGIDPIVIPYGTQLYVPGYGVGIAADTGGPRSTRLWIDLGYDDANWVSWSKVVDVYLLTPVPSEIDYMLPG